MKLFLFFLIGFFWGGSFIAIKTTVSAVPPVAGAALRLAVALILCTIIFLITKKPFAVPRAIRNRVWMAGLFAMGIPFSLVFYGERTISPGLAGILNGTVPLWTFIIGFLFFNNGEKNSTTKLVGLIIGLVGVSIIYLPKLLMGGEWGATIGCLSVGLMSVSYGVGNTSNRAIMTGKIKVDRNAILFQQVLVSLIFLIVTSLIFEGVPKPSTWPVTWKVVLSIIYLGTCSTAIAFFIFLYLIHEWGAFRASTSNYLIPIFAVLLDFIINNELPTPGEFVGVIAILVGVLLVQSPSENSKKAS